MPITELLEQNCKMYGNDICLVEINPEVKDKRRVTWKEYELIEPSHDSYYRREITWNVFNEKANRFANLLLSRGVKKGDKVAILLMNCLEWLPIYFGILKTGALAVPLNFRYSSKEIEYCLDLSESDVLIFGPEFIGRIEEIADRIITNRLLFFFGENCPTFAEDYNTLTADCSSMSPNIMLTDKDDAAIYFSSGTTGFPKASSPGLVTKPNGTLMKMWSVLLVLPNGVSGGCFNMPSTVLPPSPSPRSVWFPAWDS